MAEMTVMEMGMAEVETKTASDLHHLPLRGLRKKKAKGGGGPGGDPDGDAGDGAPYI